MATYYGVTAGGNWSTSSTWASSSGGTGGAGVPTASDDVILDSNSGSITINAAAACRSLDCTAGTGTYAHTLTHTAAFTLSIGTSTVNTSGVALKFTSGMTYTLGSVTTSVISFVSTSTTQVTITSAGKTLGNVTFSGSNGSWLLSDGFTTGSTSVVTLSAGTLNTNGTTNSWGSWVLGASGPTITLGSSSITIMNGNGSGWAFGLATCTFNAGTSTLTFTGSGARCQAMIPTGSPTVFNNIVFQGSGPSFTTSGSSPTSLIANNITFTGTASKTESMSFVAGNTAVTGTLTITGNSAINRIGISTSYANVSTPGQQATISVVNPPSLTYCDFADIAIVQAGGTAPTVVQTCDSGTTAIASGSAWSMASSVTSGNAVALCLAITNTSGISVSGLGASWSQVNHAQEVGGQTGVVEWWVGTGCTGGSAITVTTANGTTYFGCAMEVSGLTSFSSAGWVNSQSFQELPLGVVSGELVVLGVVTTGALSSAPPSPWVDYNSGGFARSLSRDVAYRTFTSTSSGQMGWGTAGGQDATTGLILSGASLVTGTSLGDCWGNAGISFSYDTLYLVGSGAQNWSTASWSTSSGGSSGARTPLSQDTAILDNHSPTSTLTQDMPRPCRNLTCTGFTGTLSISTSTTIFGDLTLASTMTYSAGGGGVTLNGRGSQTVTNAGQSLGAMGVSSLTGTYQMQDSSKQLSGKTWGITSGTLDLNNFNHEMTSLSYNSGSVAGLLLGSGTLTVGAWATNAGGLVITPGTSTIVISPAASTTFGGGSRVYNNLTVATGVSVTVSGNNTFNTLTVQAGAGVILPASGLQTVTQWQTTGRNFGYLVLPGIVSNYVSTPNATPLDITGDITIDINLALASWTSLTASVALVSKWTGTSSTSSWIVELGTTGRLSLTISNGSSNSSATAASAAPFSAGGAGWLRTTRQQSSGTTQFYYSSNGTSWTQIGTNQTVSAGTAMANVAQEVEIGSYNNGASLPLPANVYEARIYNGYQGAGTLVFDANFATKPFGVNSFTESSTNAATVNVTGAVAQLGDGRVSVSSSTAGTQSIISVLGTMSIVQVADSGSSTVASGSAWNMTSNVGAGNTVAMCVVMNTGSTGVSAVSGLGATWTNISKQEVGTATHYVEWWMGTAGTTPSKAITVTTQGSEAYMAGAFEIIGASAEVTGGTASGTTGTTGLSLTFSGLAASWLLLAAISTTNNLTADPSAPWTVYNSGGWLATGNKQNFAYQLTTGTSSQTATWSQATSSNWGAAGMILEQAATITSLVSANYLVLQDSAATGGATFYAGANSVNVSNNSGWIFANAPVSSGSTLLLMGVG